LSGTVTLRFHVLDPFHCPEGAYDDKMITFAASSISVQGIPPLEINACEGTDTLVTVVAQGLGLSYQWTVSENGDSWSPVKGANSNELTFNTISAEDAGYYSCIIMDVNSCMDTGSVKTQVIVHSYPVKPVIEERNDTLISMGSYENYQWLDGSVNIISQSNVLLPADDGVYQLRVSDNGYCWSVSDPYNWSYNAIQGTVVPAGTFYPNPATNQLIIHAKDDLSAIINLYGLSGILAASVTLTGYTFVWDISSIEKGTYLFEMIENGKVSTREILIFQ
jgi:hypothetical protein